MKKIILCSVFVFMSLLFCDVQDMTGKWTKLTWDGYKPYPDVTVQDNVISVGVVTSKKGFELKSTLQFKAKSGDKVVFNGTIKGKGKVILKTQSYDKDNKWLGIPKGGTSIDIPTEWDNVNLTAPVLNMKGGMTEKVAVTLFLTKGSTLQLKDSTVAIEEGDSVGDLSFPRQFTVFVVGKPEENIDFPKDAIPQELYGVKPMNMVLNNNQIDFDGIMKARVLKQNAVLYAKLSAPADMEYDLGAGADYFMAYYVNGVKVIDTMTTGNVIDTSHFSNHRARVKLHKGDNLIAIHFQSGSGKRPRLSLGGAADLRNLSSVLRMSDVYEADDYEKEIQRVGNPKIIQGILTEGMEVKSGQAVYPKGATISSGKKYTLPSKAGEKYFAVGLRVCRFLEMGSIDFRLGEGLVLKLSRKETLKNDIDVAVLYNGKRQKSMRVPCLSLPNDVLFAVSRSEYFVNVSSLNDSRLRSFNGKLNLENMGEFSSSIYIETENAAVDEYKLGLAMKEIRNNNVPMKLELAPEFDPVKAGWKLVWQDEFNGTEVDWENTWMNKPWAPTSPESIASRKYASVKDGMLHIKCVWDKQRADGTYVGHTARLCSRRHFGYGYYEARVRFTKKPGWWAAFWMNNEGRNCFLGGGYEIDIFEDYTIRRGGPMVACNLHVTRGPNQNSYGSHFRLPGTLDDFYVIGMKWTPFELSLYLNGKLVEARSQHTPLTSLTYDALNHALCLTKQYICLSGQAGQSGGRATEPGEEEYLVDYVRAYEYPVENAPKVKWSIMPKSIVKDGDKLQFAAEADREVEVAYLYDNGFLVDYKTSKPFVFDVVIDKAHYADTRWNTAGRSGRSPRLDCYPHVLVVCVQDKAGNVGMTEVFPVIVGNKPGEPMQIFELPGSVKATEFNKGGHNVCSYKQEKSQGRATGTEVHDRKNLHLREAGEYVTYSVDVKKAGRYKVTMKRWNYRREWATRALLIANGKYVGMIIGEPNTDAAYAEVELEAGRQELVVISAGTFGLQPAEFIFELM
ncbi:MAG: family 16 glycosylhydrolase [Victivallales bacterium]|nr:family 16 glycosylhydrolase [Victivallales bacterium]